MTPIWSGGGEIVGVWGGSPRLELTQRSKLTSLVNVMKRSSKFRKYWPNVFQAIIITLDIDCS